MVNYVPAGAGFRSSCWLALLLIAALVSCNDREEPAPTSGTDPPQQANPAAQQTATTTPGGPVDNATFAFVANFRGFQRPCGCEVAQFGGLPRLGTIVEQFAQALGSGDPDSLENLGVEPPEVSRGSRSVWLVDCGSFANPGMLYPDLRARTHIEALAAAGAVCAVLGTTELQLVPENARHVFTDAPLPVVSCNIESRLEGIEISDYIQPAENWAVIGVTSLGELDVAGERWWEFAEPVDSVRQVLASLPEKTNVVVTAVGQPTEVLLELSRLAITGLATDVDFQADPSMAVTVVASIPQRGTVIQLLSSQLKPEPATLAWSILSTEDWADSPGVIAVLEAEKQERKARLKQDQAAMWGEGGLTSSGWEMSGDFLPPGTGLDADPVYAGHTACQACHSAEYEVWENSAHSHALKSLEDGGENETLDCLQCHTTGLYERTGYNMFNPAESVGSVTCEACHGPGSHHVKAMTEGESPDAGLFIKRADTGMCIKCHDAYNSPHFELPGYWESIGH